MSSRFSKQAVAGIGLMLTALVAASVWSAAGSARTDAAWPPAKGWTAGKPVCKLNGKPKVGFLQPLADPSYALIYGIIKRDLGKAGATTSLAVANLNPGKQIADIKAMVQKGVKVLIVAAVDPRAIQGALADARRKGVKIVATDVFLGGPYVTNVATSPYDGGLAGAAFLKRTVGSGQVTAIEGPTFAGEVLTSRNRGFAAGAASNQLNVAEKRTITQFTPDNARQIVEAWKQKYGPDLKGIWTFNDLMALGAASALGGGFNPVIFGMNGEPPAIALIKAGRMGGTADLQPAAIAHTLSFAANSALCGRALPKTVFVPVKVITRANVAKWVPWSRLPTVPFTVKFTKRSGKTFVVTG